MLDYNDFYDMHLAEQEKWLAKRPKCCCCDEHIQDDFLYDIGGDLYCEECMEKEFRRYAENYIED